MTPSIKTLYETIDYTWPSASIQVNQGWLVKNGLGGGKRVSATLQLDPQANIKNAEKMMEALSQNYLFMIRENDSVLDYKLDKLGYDLIDPVVIFCSPISLIDKSIKGVFHSKPNTIMKRIWLNGGVSSARLNIMKRTKVSKTFILIDNKAVAFVAIHNDIAMFHALEVLKEYRREGLAKIIMQQINVWASTNGAKFISAVSVKGNIPARNFYLSIGMSEVGYYHYRLKT